MKSSYDVVLTGIGLVTPLGPTRDQTWEHCIAGTSGLSKQREEQRQLYECSAVGLVKGEQAYLDAILDQKNQSKTDRFVHLALMAAREALDDAGLLHDQTWDRVSCGTYIGVGLGGLDTIASTVIQANEQGYHRVSPFIIPRVISNQAAGWISRMHQLQGPLAAVTTACSSGGDAIGLAFRLVRDGYASRMVAGGSENCVTALALGAFNNMKALSTWSGDPAGASRPFDAQRCGFVMGEGAGVVVLERKEDALRRGAPIYAELAGYGAAADAYHVAAMHPEGHGPELAIRRALQDAGINADEVDYINAHGTGTLMNDQIESNVIKKIFPHSLASSHGRPQLAVSSTKSMMGHLLGAAGAVECALTALALRYGYLPPTINRDTADPACDLDYVPLQGRQQEIRVALSNAFGFGGGCSSLALKRV